MTDPIALEDRAEQGVRRFSPSAARNRDAIRDVLAVHLPKSASILEIAAGTGEHAVHMVAARPDLTWQPTDPDPDSRASQDSWRSEAPGAIRPSLPIDVMVPEWWGGLPKYDAIFCANMIHIAPWGAAIGLADGASQALQPGGRLYLYGPFLKGPDSMEGNLAFDANLRSRNPSWGVRQLADVKHLFATRGLRWLETVAMPANNDVLVFGG